MSSNQKPVVARKRFGQNFLHDTVVLQQMVAAIAPQANDTVVEICPGRGELTDRLLQRIPSIHAIEIDRDLVKLLQQRYSKDQLILYQQDVLKFDCINNASQRVVFVGDEIEAEVLWLSLIHI